VSIPQDTAWRLFTKAVDPRSAAAKMEFHGNRNVGKQILQMICIVA
jgi:hypothetical protein